MLYFLVVLLISVTVCCHCMWVSTSEVIKKKQKQKEKRIRKKQKVWAGFSWRTHEETPIFSSEATVVVFAKAHLALRSSGMTSVAISLKARELISGAISG